MNIPNIISLIRLVLVPVFVYVFFSGRPLAHQTAGLLFVLASATDALDGYIARKYNLITQLGRILDPLADKLMTFAALICITIAGYISSFIVWMFFIKEILMGIGALILYKKKADVPPSNILGKIATTSFFIFLTLLMLFESFRPYSTAMILFALTITFLALLSYAVRFIKTLRKKN